jgi:hypothetical protein
LTNPMLLLQHRLTPLKIKEKESEPSATISHQYRFYILGESFLPITPLVQLSLRYPTSKTPSRQRSSLNKITAYPLTDHDAKLKYHQCLLPTGTRPMVPTWTPGTHKTGTFTRTSHPVLTTMHVVPKDIGKPLQTRRGPWGRMY